MYARVTPFKMKAGSKEAAKAIMDGLKDRILAIDGMQHFINVMDDDGNGYVVALTTNAETPPEVQERINALWGAFGEHLEARPEAQSFTVMANWPV